MNLHRSINIFLVIIAAPVIVATPAQLRNCDGSVRHVHLAVGPDPSTSMTVSFSSIPAEWGIEVHGAVVIGTDPNHMDQLILEEEDPFFYTSIQPRGKNYSSPYQHHITITDLNPRTTYFYMCLTRNTIRELLDLQEDLDILRMDKEGIAKLVDVAQQNSLSESMQPQRRHLLNRLAEEQSLLRRRLSLPPYDSTQCACPDPHKIRKFSTPGLPGHSLPKMAILGDIGQFPHSEATLDHLRVNHADIDLITLAGDLAYPDLDHRRWDTFMDFFDDYPLIEYVPMHITPGNHDIDKPLQGNQIFASYEARFRMPRIQPAELGTYDDPVGRINMDRPPYPLEYQFGNAYYAFQYGKTHQIFISSYSAMEPGSKQYEWLIKELQGVNRKETPWLIVTYHVPIYNTFQEHQQDYQRFKTQQYIEPLLVEYKVNLVFNGHIHAYLRTKPVAFGNLTKTGPIHIVMGAGGRNAKAEFLSEEPEEWVAVRDATTYGYGLLEICNKTHARWDWIHTGQESDHNAVFKKDIILPPGGMDHTYFVNQYFLQE
jgi:acid phosphatase type 7